MLAHNRPIVCR